MKKAEARIWDHACNWATERQCFGCADTELSGASKVAVEVITWADLTAQGREGLYVIHHSSLLVSQRPKNN